MATHHRVGYVCALTQALELRTEKKSLRDFDACQHRAAASLTDRC